MGPQEMLDRAEVKNKWQLTPLKDFLWSHRLLLSKTLII